MVPPSRILELVEAVEISAEKSKYPLSTKQRIFLSRLKVKAEKDMYVSNNYWELLCDLYNEIEGRKRQIINEGFGSSKMLSLAFILTVFGILFYIIFKIIGVL